MSPAWISVWVAVGAIVVGLTVQGLMMAFHFGKHSARLDTVEKACQDANASAGVLAGLTATVHALKEQVGGLDRTIRDLLLQRTREGRGGGEG